MNAILMDTAMSSESHATILNKLTRRLRDKECVPIISNTLATRMIWGDEDVVSHWAKAEGYPLSDNHELPHVAQYHRLHYGDEATTKDSYLEFLTEKLVASYLIEASPDLQEIAKNDKKRKFTDMAVNVLGFRKRLKEPDNPFAILAQLDFPVYLTTSYHGFLEEALHLAGKVPQSGYYYWQEKPPHPEPDVDPFIKPTVEKPLVYHLFGKDEHSRSLVLTEDNYFEFYERVLDDFRTNSKAIPYELRSRLSNSALILLGYELASWDLRILFRGPIRILFNDSRPQSISIQLERLSNNPDTGQITKYLQSYFGRFNFHVFEESVDEFLKKLRQQWES